MKPASGLLSAMIITHERRELFARAYRSLVLAVGKADGPVPVTVYNSSAASVQDLMDSLSREVHVPDQGRAVAKRALAVAQCRTDWLVTLDDDCEIAPWALRIIQERIAADGNPLDRVGAYFVITGFSGNKDFWFKAMEDTDLFTDFHWAGQRQELPWGPTSLAVLNVRAVREAGGFDDSIRLPVSGEDVDVCLRLRRCGYRLLGIPETLAVHTTETWTGMRKNLRRNRLYGAGELALVERWPEYRTYDGESLALMVGGWGLLGLLSLAAGRGFAAVAMAVVLFPLALVLSEAAIQAVELRKPPVQALALALLNLAFKLGYQFQGVRQKRWGLLFKHLDFVKLSGGGPRKRCLWKPLLRWSAVAWTWGLAWLAAGGNSP